jgi:TonB family protein
VPEKSDFLAEKNNSVSKQTRAREQTKDYRNVAPQRTAPSSRSGPGQDEAVVAQQGGNEGAGQEELPMQAGKAPGSALEVPKVKPREEIALRPPVEGPGAGPSVKNQRQSDSMEGNSRRLRIQKGEGEEEGQAASLGRVGSRGLASLLPSSAVVDRIVGAAPADRLEDVEEGEGTFLNTKEWKFAGFMNRVKQSVGWHWHPNEELRRRDPTGNIYSGRDRHTLLHVTLDEQGMVKDMYVEKSSGLDFLDIEAMRSFERAQPFPHPPRGMMEDGETVSFRFGFYLDMSGGPRLRLFRPR